eukprot:1781024-Pyramimonas_sp.AAC.1
MWCFNKYCRVSDPGLPSAAQVGSGQAAHLPPASAACVSEGTMANSRAVLNRVSSALERRGGGSRHSWG